MVQGSHSLLNITGQKIVCVANLHENIKEIQIYVLYSHKKRKDSLEGCLDRVLLATELEFPEILVPRLPQNASNVNTECAGKSKQLYSICDRLLGALIYLSFDINSDINLFLVDYASVNYVIYGCSSARTTPGVSLYGSLALKEKYCCSYY